MDIIALTQDFYIPKKERGMELHMCLDYEPITLYFPRKAHGLTVCSLPESRLSSLELTDSNYILLIYYDGKKQNIDCHSLINVGSFNQLIRNLNIVLAETLSRIIHIPDLMNRNIHYSP